MNSSEVKPSKILNVLVWLAIVPSLIGEFFKIQHWPGASILMMFGAFKASTNAKILKNLEKK